VTTEKKMNDYENEETEIMTNEVAETATGGEDEWGVAAAAIVAV
jgi:hypothetical protein